MAQPHGPGSGNGVDDPGLGSTGPGALGLSLARLDRLSLGDFVLLLRNLYKLHMYTHSSG